MVVVLLIGIIVSPIVFFIYHFCKLYWQNVRAENILKKNGNGKVCVITGGSNGIGLASVKLFASNGWRVFALDKDQKGLDELEKTAENNDWTVETMICDITNRESLESASEKIKKEIPHISCLVNNAGLNIPKPTLSLSYEQMNEQMTVNLLGPIYLTKLLKENLIVKNKRSSVINIASVAADAPFPWCGVYSSSKYGLEGFSSTLRKEAMMSQLNLDVVTIKPAGTKTHLLMDALDNLDGIAQDAKGDIFYNGIKKTCDQSVQMRENQSVMNYFLHQPEDVAKIIHLAANEKNPQHEYHVCRPFYYVFNLLKRLLPSKLSDHIPVS